MQNRKFLAAAVFAAFVSLTGCSTTTTSGKPTDAVAERHSINADVDAALSKLYAQAPASRQLVEQSKGVLVLPSVVSAGFIVGGSYGQGALRSGMHSVAYYSTTAASVGLLAGADSKSIFLLFRTQEAFDKFRASQGWTAGADASVTALTVGADGGIDTNSAQHAVTSFVLSNGGLMANLSIDGSKFTRLDL
jgi:lipid-binding SYLF domain-containing protein